MTEHERARKQREAGLKAAATKGPKELSRAGKMAAYTRKHGKNDSKNPYARTKVASAPKARSLERQRRNPAATMKPTHALSIRPPWIDAILRLGKRTENRDWPEGYAGLAQARRLVGHLIYLHAGKGSRADYENAAAWISLQGLGPLRPWNELPRGALVATARLVRVVEQQLPGDEWTMPGMVGLILGEVKPLPAPIPCRGSLGFFHVGEQDQSSSAPRKKAAAGKASVPRSRRGEA